MADLPAELAAQDERIDDLVSTAGRLVRELKATVADMKKILSEAETKVEEQQQISKETRRGRV